MFSGFNLAKYGDLLALKTGWGRFWVGTLLVAIGTSLPELATVISAVRLDSPDLATGNVLGANMVNMFTMAFVAILFGGRQFFNRVAPEQGYLAALAISLTFLVVIMSSIDDSVHFARIGPGAVVIFLLYLGGMRMVYLLRPTTPFTSVEPDPAPSLTLRRTWMLFGLASLGVIAAAPVLAWSANEIADITGVSEGFMGLVAVAVVTTLPEATVTVAAVRMGAVDLAVGDLYGSCAFNMFILTLADPFYRDGPLLSTLDEAQVAAGLFAVLLMSLGAAQFLLRRGGVGRLPPLATPAFMCLLYLGGLFTVYQLD